jgi:hypothetical protein
LVPTSSFRFRRRHGQESDCSPVDRISDAEVWRRKLAGVRHVRGVVVPPRPERVGDRPVLDGRQPPPEFALDDLPVSGNCRGVALPAVGGEHRPDAATVAGYRLAPDQAGGLNAVHQPGQAEVPST